MADLHALRAKLRASAERACKAIENVLQGANPLRQLKFERLGCDPVDVDDAQNIAEQIDQQATYEVAVDALEWLMVRTRRSNGTSRRGHTVVVTTSRVWTASSPPRSLPLSRRPTTTS